ncbi:MAG: hypothetical protein DMG40_17770 [Acidobacteria bacterium]|nr:MAG: hypothetical protein DMG40_17770 [Acidobacteriota bacterium]
MRKWGVLISIIYALIVLGLLTPMAVLLAGPSDLREFSHGVLAAYREWLAWFPIVIVLGGQALLFFLSVDTSQKRLKPRSHILLSCVLAGILTALLAFALIGAIGVAVQGDRFGEGAFANPFLFFGLAWLFWGIVFYFFLRNSSEIVNRVMSWLLRGSILELLVVVPCHVIVRRRHDCSAPMVTSFGIITGMAIMLLSFGPSVLFLYKKRLEAYASRPLT